MAGLLMVAIALAAPASGTAAAVPAGGRSWELVTPSEPVSATVLDALGVRNDGARIVYETLGTMPDALGGDAIGQSFATRTETGWQTRSIGGAYDFPKFDVLSILQTSVRAISTDFSTVLKVSAAPSRPEAPDLPRIGLYRWTVDAGLGPAVVSFEGIADLYGASDDIGRIVFGTNNHILPSDAGRLEGRSMYVAEGSTIKQVDVDTAGELLSPCGSSVPFGTDGVSSSGDRVYFVNPGPEEKACETPPRLFLRESDGTTTEVSASRCSGAGCGATQAAYFAAATPSGSTAFFTTAQRLIDADENSKTDLYRFDTDTGALALVSPESAGTEGEVMNEPAFTSSDGSVVYFYAQGPLLPEEGAHEPNLYVADQSGIRLVAPAPGARPEVSVDGRHAALVTNAALVPADTDASTDVYVFDEESGKFTIASQGSSGGNDAFEATTKSSIVTAFYANPARHAFSSDGTRVFFETAERLVPEDQNEILDVYEWHSGELGLISSGMGSIPARFAAASPNGETVVFRTAASLLPRDRDGGDLDLYAARPGGGFVEEEPAPPSPSCDASCSASAATPIERPLPASANVRSKKKPKIKLRPIGEDACRDLLRNGRSAIAVVVPEPGRVTAVAVDRIDGKRRTLLRGVAGAVKPGSLRLSLVAAPMARAELRKRHRLRVRLVLRQGASVLARRLTLECRG
jgi:hypothetical protein